MRVRPRAEDTRSWQRRRGLRPCPRAGLPSSSGRRRGESSSPMTGLPHLAPAPPAARVACLSHLLCRHSPGPLRPGHPARRPQGACPGATHGTLPGRGLPRVREAAAAVRRPVLGPGTRTTARSTGSHAAGACAPAVPRRAGAAARRGEGAGCGRNVCRRNFFCQLLTPRPYPTCRPTRGFLCDGHCPTGHDVNAEPRPAARPISDPDACCAQTSPRRSGQVRQPVPEPAPACPVEGDASRCPAQGKAGAPITFPPCLLHPPWKSSPHNRHLPCLEPAVTVPPEGRPSAGKQRRPLPIAAKT